MFNRLAHFLTERPLIVVPTLLAITVVAAALAVNIQFEFSPQTLFQGDAQLIRDLEEFKETFGHEDSILLVVIQAEAEADVLDRHLLTWQHRLIERLHALRGISQCVSLATMEVPRRTLGLIPTVVPRPLIREFPVSPGDEQRVRRFVDDSPLVTGTLISHDRRTAAVLLYLDPELQGVAELTPVVGSVETSLAGTPPPAGFKVSLTGLPYIRTDTVANLQSDQLRLLPVAALLYLVALTLAFRRLGSSLLPLLAVGMGLDWTIGSTVAMGESFNLISNVLPVLLIVIGISNCVHVIDDYAEQSSATDGNRLAAAQRTVRHMSRSCLLTFFTTGVGFACLLTARSEALQQFGWQAALGMACLYVTIIGTLGCLLRYFRPPRRSAAGAPLGHMTAVAGHLVDRHPRVTFAASLMAIGIALWFARGVAVNSYMIETYPDDHPTLKTLRLVERELSGLLPIEIELKAEHPDRLIAAETCRRVNHLEKQALEIPGVLFARSYMDILQSIAASTPGQDSSGEQDASDAALARDIQRGRWVVDRVGSTLGYPHFMSTDGTRARILIKVRDIGTRKLRQLIAKLKSDLQAAFPPGYGITWTMTGDAYVNTIAMNEIIYDLFASLLTASLIIFVAIGLIFRSFRIGLIASIPNLTPLTITLGYMGLRGYDMNVGNVIVFTISLGIAVDDSIHFLYRFREEMKRHNDVDMAIGATYEGTGRAIVVTSLLIISGLGVLLFSSFLPTQRFAELTSVTMLAALMGDLLLLPACLVLFWKRPDSSTSSPDIRLVDGT